jgi:hypothetical protein
MLTYAYAYVISLSSIGRALPLMLTYADVC